GMGQALTEEMIWKDGLLMNPGLLEYRSPSSVESPEVEAIIVESIDPEGPFGAKEASEGSLAATIPAIANAIYDAVGIRLHESPFSPERPTRRKLPHPAGRHRPSPLDAEKVVRAAIRARHPPHRGTERH